MSAAIRNKSRPGFSTLCSRLWRSDDHVAERYAHPGSPLGSESRLAAKDAPVVVAMRELSAQYRHFGYRRIHAFLGRRGHEMSTGRAPRLWRQEGLQVLRKRPRGRISTGRPRPLLPERIIHVWTYDFIFDG